MAGAAIAYQMAKTSPDIFTASAIIAVEAQHINIPELQGAVSGTNSDDPVPQVLTEVQVLTSPRLIQWVIDTLHLENDPEFVPAKSTIISQILHKLAEFAPNTVDTISGLSNSIGIQTYSTPVSDDNPDAKRQRLLNAVSKRLAVAHDTRSLIVDIKFSSERPKIAADFVNTLIAAYEQAGYDDRQKINKIANNALQRRIDDIHAQVLALEDKVRIARAKNNLPELVKGNVNQQQLLELITAATHAAEEHVQAEALAERARSLANSGATDALASVVASETISRLRDQESVAAAKVANDQALYGANNPTLQAAVMGLQSIRRQIAAEVKRNIASLYAQAATAAQRDEQAQAALRAARQNAVITADSQLEVRQLEEEAKARRTLYESLLTRTEQTETDPSNQMPLTGARVISGAVVPGIASSPNRGGAVIVGAVAGMLLGAAIALFRGITKRRFRRREELEDMMGLPVLVQLPFTQSSGKMPKSEEAESLRLLRANLRYSAGMTNLRTVVFVSAGGRGNSAGAAVSFARVAARDGERVLLIEGSLADPRLPDAVGQKLLGDNDYHFDAVLSQPSSLPDFVTADPLSGMDMLLIEPSAPMPLDLVHGPQFRSVLSKAAENYGLIVIHAPEAMRSETLALAHWADATVLVVGGQRVDCAKLRAVVNDITNIGSGLTAAVLAA